jgi:hypothetical protein
MKNAVKASAFILLLLLASYAVPAYATTYYFGGAEKQLSPATDEVAAGYYNATTLHAVDSDLAAGNIKSGTTIFGITGNLAAGISYGIPKTGQATVFKTGDDSTYKKGTPVSGAKYTNNGDGTVTDNGTGLMWVADGTGAGCNSGNKITWANAISFCENLTFAGYDDWRLPNIKELHSLINYGNYDPAIGELRVGGNGTGAPFIHTQPAYWSSTSCSKQPLCALYADFIGGMTVNDYKTYADYYVRAVRGGQ